MQSIRKERWGYLSYAPSSGFGFHPSVPAGVQLRVGQRTICERHLSNNTRLPSSTIPLSGPLTIGFMLTRRCNLRCRYCFASALPEEADEQTGDLLAIAERLTALNPLAVWISGGEPSLSVSLPNVLRYFDSERVPVSLDTNGTRLTDSLLTLIRSMPLASIRLSLDSLTPDINDQTRSAGTTVLHGLGRLLDAGIVPIVCTVITTSNGRDLFAMHAKLRALGIKTWILFSLVPSGRAVSQWDSLAPADDSLSYVMSALQREREPPSIIHISGTSPNTVVLVDETGEMLTVDGARRTSVGNVMHGDPCHLWDKLPIDAQAYLKKYITRS